ncbi:polysaccharide pyruvyl transferase family protein [Paenibacillus sp. MMS20-IR301]|uniref:polysaccharide pyruvyl transferase family protein n=1 Tax=Paenibacillus sp. MMS20-IR301 TaxID=2895946 RepID=UPI0028EF7FBA|nr:polysaccharide pyruvyl transferase family protein [Paenibacillus sp. MMS20-IR301]WNS41981.1 polysaccharide pyruvyl transferase family protein [Paenibacillus sp. MMS20-IR301]
MTKTLMIAAYTEFNLGDDLFIKVLCERYPDTRFRLIAPQAYKLVFKEQRNLKVYASDSVLLRGINYLFRKTKLHPNFVQKLLTERSDGTVHIGGSIFMQGEGWEEYVANAENLRNKSKPYFLMGANFGPYQDEAYYRKYREIFREYADVSFREQYSYDLFKDLGNVRLAPDIIFQLKYSAAPVQAAEGKILAISVIKPSAKALHGYDKLYYDKMKDIAVHFIRQGYAVHFLSFCQHEGDQEAIGQILNLIPAELQAHTHAHFYSTDINAILAVLAGASCIIASRFHAMILGWVFGKPVFPVAYSSKMVNVMQDARFGGGYTDFKHLAELTAEQVYAGMAAGTLDVMLQANQAEKHFEQLDAYLEPQPLLEGRRSYES